MRRKDEETEPMRSSLLTLGALIALAGAGAAEAKVVTDPVGDFLPSYTGPKDADLDVTRFSVKFDAAAAAFKIEGTLAGAINTASSRVYVIGVDTGAGAVHLFDDIGESNVVFDQAVVVSENGSAGLFGGPALTATISGRTFSVTVPLSLLPSTGFAADHYGFNLWPRLALPPAGNEVVSDFSPQNALITGVPEPSAWAVMALGLFGLGGVLRARRRLARDAALA
jgi:hypothetical protein